MRQKYQTRKILIRGADQKALVKNAIDNLPLDPDSPLEVVIREQVKSRSADQNSLLWAVITEISNQAWIDGMQYSPDVWHEFLKREFLPAELDTDLTKDGYVKWADGPDGYLVLLGSTTQLTKRGFSEYMEQVYAYGANLGVQFHEREAA